MFGLVVSLTAVSLTSERDWFASVRLSEDLELWAQVLVFILLALTIALLIYETARQKKRRFAILLTGMLATSFLALAVLRPTELRKKGREVPGIAMVLLDASHRLDLPSEEASLTRRMLGDRAASELQTGWESARLEEKEFGAGLVRNPQLAGSVQQSSDLLQTLHQVASGVGERPSSIVVMSDGRFTRPGEIGDKDWQQSVTQAAAGIPVHTVSLLEKAPSDRSIRSVGFTGTAVAHQPIALQLEVGCEPRETCDSVEVVVRELLEGQEPVELVRGEAKGADGLARLELSVTLERAGGRVIEVELLSDEVDDIVENDKRILPVQVRRDRLRMLHVAGRPTYDVRALRMFLKSDESIDLISFFILRTPSDQVGARQEELALIPFPVDELFSDHLKSFDAVILQDMDAPRYRLDRHFHSIRDYVLSGGGLILVGGPTGFSKGGYAGSPIEDILPVELPLSGKLVAHKPFSPLYTDTGRAAPMLGALRSTMGEELPTMSGANMLGRAKEGALVLWEHPKLHAAGQSAGQLMPVLALGEMGDGRSIAISVDSTHELRFGELGAVTGGRGYSALWEGLLGWLMRDPRYESAQMRLEGDCVAGKDQLIRVDPLPQLSQEVSVTLQRLGTTASDQRSLEKLKGGEGDSLRFVARELAPGGYAARVKVGKAPPTRAVFACEVGGASWADSRPDVPRLESISEVTGGRHVKVSALSELPEPKSTFVAVKRESRPLLAPWIWASLAAFAMSAHWVLRRAVGYV